MVVVEDYLEDDHASDSIFEKHKQKLNGPHHPSSGSLKGDAVKAAAESGSGGGAGSLQRERGAKSTNETAIDYHYPNEDDVIVASTILFSIFVTFILGLMEYFVLDRFHNPNPWTFDIGNPYFINWAKRTATSAAAICPIVYLTFLGKKKRGADVVMLLLSLIVSGTMVYIIKSNPSAKLYSYLPGLSALWILLTAQMNQIFAFVSLVGTMAYYFGSFQF